MNWRCAPRIDENIPPITDLTPSEDAVAVCDGGIAVDSRPSNSTDTDYTITIENLGGISHGEFSLPRGISTLVGRNATNRSSACRALAAALGGDESAATLKTDADEGVVKLSVGDRTYTREYTKVGQSVQKRGQTYADDADLVDTFVALFVDCPARQAVERGEDLRELLMKPVDTEEIQSRIAELKRQRADLDDLIEDAEQQKRELPGLEEDRTRLTAELDAVEEEIAGLESDVEDIESTAETDGETTELRSELDSLRTDLSAAERRLDETQQQLEFRADEREELLDERDSVESQLEAFDDAAKLDDQIAELETEIQQLSAQRTRLDQAVEDLQSVIQANETFLEEDIETVGLLSDDSVTDALDPDSQTVECWTCGTAVEQGDISTRIETLREIAAHHRTEITELAEDISQLDRKKASYESKLEEYEKLTRRVEELDDRIEQHADNIQELERQREEIAAEIDDLEDQVATVEAEIEQVETREEEETTEFVEAHKKLTELERERGRLENQIADTDRQIDEIQTLDEKRADAEDQRALITEELEELRGRIDRLETELVETLNSIMEDLIQRLEYNNIARVWLERQTADAETDSSFELHIVREGEDGTVYEDTVDTLSESEREVIGLVVSLAGYLVHDVDQKVPFLILDSVEMIDGKRLAALLEYIDAETDVEFLSVALLPKDAASAEEAADFERYSRIDFGTA